MFRIHLILRKLKVKMISKERKERKKFLFHFVSTEKEVRFYLQRQRRSTIDIVVLKALLIVVLMF